MVDYQFLAMVAAGLAVVTREVLPVVLMTAVIALVMLAYEAATRRYHRRIDFGGPAAEDPPTPSDTDLTRWVSVMDRMLRSPD
ncbi:MAG TPA: hypothetical protein VFW57_06655 [Acidimicrobiia bacterium]|nr:hypothetical protein [Acidimicrobiia bacterium]